jgi:hypothetical protein
MENSVFTEKTPDKKLWPGKYKMRNHVGNWCKWNNLYVGKNSQPFVRPSHYVSSKICATKEVIKTKIIPLEESRPENFTFLLVIKPTLRCPKT